MSKRNSIHIAGLTIPLRDVEPVLAELQNLYQEFQQRTDAFKADPRNPHLCHEGCSHCCKSGAVFAVTLAEALQWSFAIDALPDPQRQQSRQWAEILLDQQHKVFAQVPGPPDAPGHRDEPLFSSRITKLNTASPACPLLFDDRCAVYLDRPMLCRAYGFPVDAYAVQSKEAIVFRSLCVLYEGRQLTDYVRAKQLKARLTDLSARLTKNQIPGRFTSPEAILSRIEPR